MLYFAKTKVLLGDSQSDSVKITKMKPNLQKLAAIVTNNIQDLWKKASLPILLHVEVQQMLKVYHLKF